MTIKKLNVLYTVDNLLIGGAQDLVKTLSLNLNRDLFNVSVCSLLDYPDKGDIEPLTDEIQAAGVDVTTLYMKDWYDLDERKQFLELLNRKKTDILHAHLFPADLWSSRMAFAEGVPVRVYSKHETYRDKSLSLRLRNSFYYNMYMDKALATSDITVRHLVEYEFLCPGKVQKILNPIDTELFSPSLFSGDRLREEYGIPAAVPVIGNIARFVPRKGIEAFIEVAYKVLQKIPEARFILVGYGEDESKYKNMVADLGIGHNFIFAGPRRDIANILSAIDIFLFTPLYGEALPISFLAAMSMEKAIIASNVCSNRELITHEVSGLLPTPEKWASTAEMLDADLLADAVIRLITLPSLREEFGRKARQRAEEVFSIPVVMKQLEDLYIGLFLKKSRH